jgi:hypothetical protein
VQKGRGEDIPDPPISWILLAATQNPHPVTRRKLKIQKQK